MPTQAARGRDCTIIHCSNYWPTSDLSWNAHLWAYFLLHNRWIKKGKETGQQRLTCCRTYRIPGLKGSIRTLSRLLRQMALPVDHSARCIFQFISRKELLSLLLLIHFSIYSLLCSEALHTQPNQVVLSVLVWGLDIEAITKIKFGFSVIFLNPCSIGMDRWRIQA